MDETEQPDATTNTRAQKERIEKEMDIERKRHFDVMQALFSERRELQENCKHTNISSGAYVQWCDDCGKEWLT